MMISFSLCTHGLTVQFHVPVLNENESLSHHRELDDFERCSFKKKKRSDCPLVA